MSWPKRSRPQTVLDLRGAGPAPDRRKRQHHIPYLPFIIAAIFAALVVAAGGGYWWQSVHTATGKTGMQTAVARVGKLMFLPASETPTFGTVSDKSKLNSQTFFKNAENGDQVLIYEKAKLSILYRPSVNKIVNVGPIVSGKTGSPYVTSRIAILNGSGSDDLLAKMTAQVTTTFPNATITAKAPASRTYPTSIVADLTAKNQPLAEQVADTLAIQGGKTPLGEPVPSADLLIIIGQDYH